MIPDAAVEAAELAAEVQGFDAHRSYVLCILEAAAQHMLAAPERASEDELVNVLRSASPDGYRPPSLRELAQAIVAAGYTRPAS